MRPLYTGLAPEDASAMVQKLHEGGVDYKIGNNGTELLVPEDRVPELRLEMAGLGLAQNRTHRIRDLRQNEFRHHRFRRARELSPRGGRRTGTLHHGAGRTCSRRAFT